MSGDGRYVSFVSYGSNLVPNDTNGRGDIFVKDLLTGSIVMASVTAEGVQADSESLMSKISDDGTVVAFATNASNFHPAAMLVRGQVFRKELSSGALKLMSSNYAGEAANSMSTFASMSADGRWVGVQSNATNLVPSSTKMAVQLYAKDAVTGFVRLVSSAADGTPANNYSGDMSFSADGRFAVFSSDASNLVAGDTNGMLDIFMKDLLSGAITRLSTSVSGAQANKGSMSPSMSADASTVTFTSQASNLTPDVNSTDDAFIASVDRAFLTAWSGLISGREGMPDSLAGTAGKDRLMGLGGADTLDGGAGIDTAVLRGYLSNFGIVRNPDGSVTVTDKTGLEGIDTLRNMERLHFDNASIALDIDGTGGQAYRLYQAAFNRTPDAGGLGFWIAQMDKGASLESVAASFMASAEFNTAYGVNPSNTALVEKFYTNVLHRAGEASGVAYWVKALDQKLVTPQQVLGMISESAENQAALIGVLQNGFSYQPFP